MDKYTYVSTLKKESRTKTQSRYKIVYSQDVRKNTDL